MPIEAAPFGAAVVAFFLTRFAPEPSVPDAAVLAVREGGARSRRVCGAVRRWLAWIRMRQRLKRAQTVQPCHARVPSAPPCRVGLHRLDSCVHVACKLRLVVCAVS